MLEGREIEVSAADGGRFAAYLTLPERTPAPGLIVLPEVYNSNEHIRGVADGYAADGFAALSPDVYWRQEPGSYLPYTPEGQARARALRDRQDPDRFVGDLGDVAAALRGMPECTGRIGLVGFCLGGMFAWLAATRLRLQATASYYGVRIDQYLDEAERLACPVLMHFAENDEHVPPETVEAIRARVGGRDDVAIHVYPGTGHGFNRKGYPPYDEAAAAQARERTLAHFRRHLVRGQREGHLDG